MTITQPWDGKLIYICNDDDFFTQLSINNDHGFFELYKLDMWFSQKIIVLSTKSNPLTTQSMKVVQTLLYKALYM